LGRLRDREAEAEPRCAVHRRVGHQRPRRPSRSARDDQRTSLHRRRQRVAFTCDAAAYPRIWDITDETHPRAISELHLPAPDVCAGNHYNNVDDSQNTKMAIIGWTTGGLRVFDLRHPSRPREIAYFKPETYAGNPSPFAGCKSVVYVDKPTGQLWFACDGGFYVVELTPQVRAYMRLPKRAANPHAITTTAWAARLRAAEPSAAGRSGPAPGGLYCALP
jgi:hypothetical protein